MKLLLLYLTKNKSSIPEYDAPANAHGYPDPLNCPPKKAFARSEIPYMTSTAFSSLSL